MAFSHGNYGSLVHASTPFSISREVESGASEHLQQLITLVQKSSAVNTAASQFKPLNSAFSVNELQADCHVLFVHNFFSSSVMEVIQLTLSLFMLVPVF